MSGVRKAWDHFLRVIGLRKREPIPPPIRIAGIYTICRRLGLPKSFRHGLIGRRMLIEMKSGQDAIYELTDWQPASSVDWDWYIFTFERYVARDCASRLPRYC